MELTFHPAAGIFPLLEGEAFEALVEDIRRNGLREPIWLHQDGCVLDGRNRYRACGRAGVEPRFQTYIGPDDSILPFVVSLNLHRRHLNESQRAMVAGRLAGMGKGRPSENAPIGGISQPDAANSLNVGTRSLQRAKKVLESGCDALVRAVDQGEVAVADAAGVAAEAHDRQAQYFPGSRRAKPPR